MFIIIIPIFKSLSSVYLSSSKFSETLQLWTDVTGGEESNLRGNLIFTQNFQKMSKHIFGTHCGNFWTKLSENVQNTSLEQERPNFHRISQRLENIGSIIAHSNSKQLPKTLKMPFKCFMEIYFVVFLQ